MFQWKTYVVHVALRDVRTVQSCTSINYTNETRRLTNASQFAGQQHTPDACRHCLNRWSDYRQLITTTRNTGQTTVNCWRTRSLLPAPFPWLRQQIIRQFLPQEPNLGLAHHPVIQTDIVKTDLIIEGLRERSEHLDIFIFPTITHWCSISNVLFTGGRGVSDFSVLKILLIIRLIYQTNVYVF